MRCERDLEPSLGPGLHLMPLDRFPWISGMSLLMGPEGKSPPVLTGARLTRNSFVSRDSSRRKLLKWQNYSYQLFVWSQFPDSSSTLPHSPVFPES